MDTRTFESFLTSPKEEAKEGVSSNQGSKKGLLVIEISHDSDLSEKNLKKVIKNIGKITQYTKIGIQEKGVSEGKSEAPALATFKAQVWAIRDRNKLIEELKLKIAPGQKSIDIWAAVFEAVIHNFVCYDAAEGMPAIIFNQKHRTESPDQKAVHTIIDEMGIIGFEKFCEYIFYKKPKLQQERLSIDPFAKHFKVTNLDVLKCINNLQKQDKYKDQLFPFTTISFRSEDPFTHTEEFYNATCDFLSKNPHVVHYDLGQVRKHIFPDKKIWNDFYKRYEEAEFLAYFRLPYHLNRREFDDLNAKIKAKRVKASNQLMDKMASETYAQLAAVSAKMPDNWWKPLMPTREKKQQTDIVYEQELELAVEKQTEVVAETTMEAVAETDVDVEHNLDSRTELGELLDEAAIKKMGGARIFDAIVGTTRYKKLGRIDYFTVQAWAQIKCFPSGFYGGITYDLLDPAKKNKLPPGFRLVKKESEQAGESKLILSYDAARMIDSKKQDGLRPFFNQNRNVHGFINEGSVALFLGDKVESKTKKSKVTDEEAERINLAFCRLISRSQPGQPEDYVEDLYILLAAIEKVSVASVKREFSDYKDILANFSAANFHGMREIVLTGQIKGVGLFLKNCKALEEADIYNVFKSCFINSSPHLIELITPESVELINQLAEVCHYAPVALWWNKIFKSHAALDDPGLFFHSKIKAFLRFCDELRKMGLDLNQLPNPGELMPVHSVHTTLNDILDILKANPKRAKEQLSLFQKVERGNDAARYAVLVDHYSFVVSEMQLQPSQSADDNQLTYAVKFSNLTDMAGTVDQKLSGPHETKKIAGHSLLAVEDESETSKKLIETLNTYSTVLDLFEFDNEADAKKLFDQFKELFCKLSNDSFEEFLFDLKKLSVGATKKFNLDEGLLLIAKRTEGYFCLSEQKLAMYPALRNDEKIIILQSQFHDLNYGQGGLKKNNLSDFINYIHSNKLDINTLVFAHCMRFVNLMSFAPIRQTTPNFPTVQQDQFIRHINNNQLVLEVIDDVLTKLWAIPQYGRILAGNISPELFIELFDLLKGLNSTNRHQLSKKAQNFLTYKATIINFYRYLGSAHTPLPIPTVRRIVKKIEDAKKLSHDVKALLLPLIAPALQGATCAYVKNEEYCDLIISVLSSLKDPLPIVQNLQKFLGEKNNYNLRDLAGLILHQKVILPQKKDIVPLDWKTIHGVGETAYKALVNLGFRAAQDITFTVKSQLDAGLILTLITSHPELNAHQESAFSAISLINFNNSSEAEVIILAFKSLAEKSPVLLNQLLAIINKINAEFSPEFPSQKIINQLIEHLEQNPFLSVGDGCDWISKKMPKVRFDEVLIGQPFTEDDFKREINEVRITTVAAVKHKYDNPPFGFGALMKIVKAFAADKDGESLGTSTNTILKELTQEVSSSEELLALFDKMIKQIDEELYPKLPTPAKAIIRAFVGDQISPLIFNYVYNPYLRTKEICIKKISEDFKQIITDEKNKETIVKKIIVDFSHLSLMKLPKTDKDIKIHEAGIDERAQFFEIYNRYKAIVQILQENKHEAKQRAFCEILCQGILDAKTPPNKQAIVQLSYTLLSAKLPFETKAFLFKTCVENKSFNQSTTFIAHFERIYNTDPACLLELQKKISEEKDPVAALNFAEKFSSLIDALPKSSDYLSILKTLLKFSNEARSKILVALQGLKDIHLRALAFHFLDNMLSRDREREMIQPQAIDELVKWINLLPSAVVVPDEKKREETDDRNQYQQFQNVNCPPLKAFVEKLNAGMNLKAIFDEIDANPLGSRTAVDVERAIESDEIKRLLDIPGIKSAAIESIREKFEKINLIDLSKLPRDELHIRLKAAMEYYKENKDKKDDAIVELLACLREWMYRTPPHRFANAMQILSILTSFELGRFTLLGVKTGQGKSIVCALQAAVMYSLGHSAVILTSDNSLSKRDYSENETFFSSLGAKSTYLEKNSSKHTFKRGGINYASTGDFALYWQAAKKRGESLKGPKGNKITISVGFDEEDDFFVTKSGSDQFISTQKIQGLGDLAWMYEHINKFADFCDEKEKYLKNKKTPDLECKVFTRIYREMAVKYADEINQGLKKYGEDKKFDVDRDDYEITALEIHTLHQYLLDKAEDPEQKAALKQEKFLVLLKKLIDSAKTVKHDIFPTWIKDDKGRESKGFHVIEKTMLRGNVTSRERHIEIVQGGRPKKGYRYSNGDHQLLTKRVESSLKSQGEAGGLPFAYDPLSSPISIWSPDTLMRKLQKDPNCVIVGCSGSPGSARQIAEKNKRYQFTTAIHPPREAKKVDRPPPIYAKNCDAQLSQVVDSVLAHRHNDDLKTPPTAVLILCQNSEKIAALTKLLNKKLAKELADNKDKKDDKKFEILVLNAKNDEQEGPVLEKVPYTIAISTMSRRGADIKMTNDAGLIHSKGLKVIDMDLVPTPEEQQGEGRTNRRGQGGIYQQVFDISEIKEQYPGHFTEFSKNLDDLTAGECETIVSNIHRSMDEKGEQRRDQTSIYGQIAYVLIKPFDKFQKEFERQMRLNLEKHELKAHAKWANALNDLAVSQQTAMDYLAAHWQELPRSLARDIPADELEKDWPLIRRMSYFHDQIKNYAVALWGQYAKELNKKWCAIHEELTPDKEVPELSESIINYDLLAALLKIRGNEAKEEPEKKEEVPQEEIQDDKGEKELDQPELEEKIDLEKIAQPIIAAINDYDQKKWFISSDRREEKKRFFATLSETKPTTFVHLLKELNTSYRNALKQDIDYANSFWRRLYYYLTFRGGQRSTTSRYREILLAKKNDLLAQCPVSQLDSVVREELEHTEKVLSIESKRSIYDERRFVTTKGLITSLAGSMKQPGHDSKDDYSAGPLPEAPAVVPLLENTITQLQPILETCASNESMSLKDFDHQSLNRLLQYSQNKQPGDHLKKNKVGRQLTEIVRQISFPVVRPKTERYMIFGSRTHSIYDNYDMKNQSVAEVLSNLDNSTRYYCYTILNDLYSKLINDFSQIAFNIERILTSDECAPEFQIQFSTVDCNGTGQTFNHQFNVKIDVRLKTVALIDNTFMSKPKENEAAALIKLQAV